MKQLLKSFGFFLSVCWDMFKTFYGKNKFYRNYGVVSVQFLTSTQITEMLDEEYRHLAKMVAQTDDMPSLGRDKNTRLN